MFMSVKNLKRALGMPHPDNAHFINNWDLVNYFSEHSSNSSHPSEAPLWYKQTHRLRRSSTPLLIKISTKRATDVQFKRQINMYTPPHQSQLTVIHTKLATLIYGYRSTKSKKFYPWRSELFSFTPFRSHIKSRKRSCFLDIFAGKKM